MSQATLLEPEAPTLPPTTLALTVPRDVSTLATGADRLIVAAEDFVVDSEAAFQVADQVQTQLKTEAKQINDKRLEFTRPIDAIKAKWMDFFKPAIDGRTRAVEIYQQKMSAYLREQREENARKQREAEAILAEQRRKQEEEAKKLEAKAARLKTEEAKQKALAEAQTIRDVATLTPVSVPVAPLPETVASNVAQPWELESITDMAGFLQWLAVHPEWHGVVSIKTGEINRMAKQFRNVVPVPGVKFHQKDSFRTKSR